MRICSTRARFRVSCSGVHAVGTPSAATVNVPDWTVVWYDANDDEVAEGQFNVTFTYLGPIPQEMVATDPVLQAGGGTASRSCQTSNLCTYYPRDNPERLTRPGPTSPPPRQPRR
ncbi:hypothetical protein [Streptomyces leeuwenhoekii]|uniref:Uncharacterized protein n=1 Tax=Streptomyces leeuwenhoekii TaxID=1437453 RepID=A0A0F7VSK7_STRLW|nr:hypothetical protein [Streptomyces leeuwenhoekii]CQR60467.1 Hypothetical Protein sle_10040 [Streptomyces leeuwenhoekii]